MTSNRELCDLLEQLIYYINKYEPNYDDVVYIKGIISELEGDDKTDETIRRKYGKTKHDEEVKDDKEETKDV